MTVAQHRRKFLYPVRRALKASPDEWRVRIQQKVFCTVNGLLAQKNRAIFPRDGHLRALGLSDSDLPEWWQDRGDRWFLNPDRTCRLRQFFAENDGLAKQIIRLADRVLEDEFPLLGHGLITLDGESRWHRDPVLGTVAPQVYSGGIRYLDVAEVGDSKCVWEPSRFGWAYWLGVAHLITGDPCYAEKFRELTLDWFDKNTYPRGIHFCSALETGFRAYAWVWALDLFRDYVRTEPTLLNRLLYGIWISCRHIQHNLSSYFSPNTHLLGEAFALYACGAAIPEFRQSASWRQTGSKILAREALKQFHHDGTHRELSSCYHLYSSDFYLQAILIARQTGLPVDPALETTAFRSAVRLAELTPNSLQLPQFNDCDGGRLTWFTSEPLDASPTLLAAKQLWDHPSLPNHSGPRNGYHLWMEQSRGRAASAETCLTADTNAGNGGHHGTTKRSDQLDSGIASYRNQSGDFLLFRSGPFGYQDCGHSHDAPTSFVFHFAGQPLIVDSGTGSYTVSHDIRDRFRGAFGKNILLVNGSGPSVPGDWFSWEGKTDALLTCAERFPGGFLCSGRHQGFSSELGFRVEVRRELVLYDGGVLIVIDEWDAEQPISCRLALTLHPKLTLTKVENGPVLRDDAGNSYCLSVHRLHAQAKIHAG
ncbi:MAG: alginate lyase family protein, partial [Planctomycetes bacterium]|nr:alginate lyase family protein [Planctomycetota bacterium]